MNKILILGAGGYQAFAIKKAKELGYFTVVISNIRSDCGAVYADEFVLCSTVDKVKALEVAIKFNVKGVFTIASERASATAAYVAGEMGLKWLPLSTVLKISDKGLFNEVLQKKNPVKFPFVVKPSISSGSKGIVVVSNEVELQKAVDIASSFSRNGKVITEGFVEGDHLGCVFVVQEGRVRFLFMTEKIINQKYCTVAHLSNTGVLKGSRNVLIERLQQVVSKLNIKEGFFDGDFVLDKNNEIHIIELGSRLGGNGVSELVEVSTGFDVISEAIKWSMGGQIKLASVFDTRYSASIIVRSERKGVFNSFEYEKEHVYSRLFVKQGDGVNEFKSGSDQLGVFFTVSDNEDELRSSVEEIMNLPVRLVN